MNSVIINLKTDPQVKREAKKIASDLGLTLSGVINAYLKQFIRTKSVFVSMKNEMPSEYLINELNKSEEDYKKGRYVSFKDDKEALRFLEKRINENKVLKKIS